MTKDEFKIMGIIERSDWLRQNYSTLRKKPRNINSTNDADYNVSITVDDGKIHCPIYRVWKGIVNRTTPIFQKADPRYTGVTLDSRWISFMAFRAWFILRYKDGYKVDKDLISDSRVYGPDTCALVPNWLNSFFGLTGSNLKGQKKAGVWLVGHKFGAYCSSSEVWLGLHSTQRKAHFAWRKEKRRLAKLRKAEMDAIDLRIYPGILRILKSL